MKLKKIGSKGGVHIPSISLEPPLSISFQWRIQDFPPVGAPTLGGAPTYDFAKFSPKLHEIERIWTPGGRVQNFTM